MSSAPYPATRSIPHASQTTFASETTTTNQVDQIGSITGWGKLEGLELQDPLLRGLCINKGPIGRMTFAMYHSTRVMLDGSAIGLDWNAIYRELNIIQLQWNTANTGEVFNEMFSGMNTLQQCY